MTRWGEKVRILSLELSHEYRETDWAQVLLLWICNFSATGCASNDQGSKLVDSVEPHSSKGFRTDSDVSLHYLACAIFS